MNAKQNQMPEPPEPEYVSLDEQGHPVENQAGEQTELVIPPRRMDDVKIVDPANLPDLDAAEAGPSVSPNYYEFNAPGEVVRAVYCGMTTIISKANGGSRELQTAVFQNKDGVWINSGANFVQQVVRIPVGSPIQITYVGLEKTNSGNNVKKFEVRLLTLA